jgi:GAF domain-containing protein
MVDAVRQLESRGGFRRHGPLLPQDRRLVGRAQRSDSWGRAGRHYYSSRRHQRRGMQALVDALRVAKTWRSRSCASGRLGDESRHPCWRGRSADANDPRWRDFRDLALAYGLRACWSTPIHGSDGTVVGTFANYYKVVMRNPSPVDLELTDRSMRAAATAIENARRP